MSSSLPQESTARSTAALGILGTLIMITAGGALIYGVIEDPAVSGPIAGTIGVVLAAILQRRWEKNQELERLRREQMEPIYAQLITILKENPGEAEAVEFFKDFTTKLLLYGPPTIIKGWNYFRLHGMSEDSTDPTTLLNYEKLLLLVRRDLGHDDSELQHGDLLRVYVNDFDETFTRWTIEQSRT